jgi:hypothetical protein
MCIKFIVSRLSFRSCSICHRFPSQTANINEAILAIQSILSQDCALVNFENFLLCVPCLHLLQFIIRRRESHHPAKSEQINILCDLQITVVREVIDALPILEHPRTPPPPPPLPVLRKREKHQASQVHMRPVR